MQTKRKQTIIFILFFLIILILGIRFIDQLIAEDKSVSESLSSLAANRVQIEKNVILMRKDYWKPKIEVDFWKVEYNDQEEKEYVGSAKIVEGRLFIETEDPKLKELLENPFTPIGEITEEGAMRDWQISYAPGSVSHLKAIAREAWRWGYIAKTKEFSDQ
jgi:hypothetical protein